MSIIDFFEYSTADAALLAEQFFTLYTLPHDDNERRTKTAAFLNSKYLSHVHFEESLYNVAEEEALESKIAEEYINESFNHALC